MNKRILRQTLVFAGLIAANGYVHDFNQVKAAAINIPPIVTGFISNLFGKDVILATAHEFKSGNPIVLNPVTGERLRPCNNNATTSQNPGCQTSFDSIQENQDLFTILNNSQRVFNGTIIKHGKSINAKIVVSVTALYEGSECITYISAGQQYESCTTLEQDCKFLLPLTRYGNKSEAIRKNVRKACGLPAAGTTVPTPAWRKQWRDKDCRNLHPVYRKKPAVPATAVDPAVDYRLVYEQYIWDTCRRVSLTPPATWGPRPS